MGCSADVNHTIRFETNGGTIIESITVDGTSGVSFPPDPSKEGFSFEGWHVDDTTFLIEATPSYFVENPVDEDITLYAKWQVQQYTIHFETEGGSEVASMMLDFGATIVKPQDPVKTGHGFGGWYLDNLFTNEASFGTMPSENITLYAKWNVIIYTLTFVDDDNRMILSESFAFGSDLNQLTPPVVEKTGHSFSGWDSILPNTMPDRDVTLKATYTINTYTIEFLDEDGSRLSLIEQVYGHDLSDLEEPVVVDKEGLVFDGWDQGIPLTMPAYDLVFKATYSSIFEYEIIDDQVVLLGLKTTDIEEIEVPESIDGKPVTSIGIYAFYGMSQLKSVIIPHGVITIGDSAFKNASGLTSIQIPTTVTTIGNQAFHGASGLTTITLPFVGRSRLATGSDASFGSIFGMHSFIGSYEANGYYLPLSLNEVILTDASTIGAYAFHGASSLTTIQIPDSVTSIGVSAFFGTSSLRELEIPNSMSKFNSGTLKGANGLTKLTLPFVGETKTATGVKAYFGFVFGTDSYEGSYRSGNYHLPLSLKEVIITNATTIGAFAFYNASSLTSIEIPSSVTSIESAAFYGASSLISIEIPYGVTSIMPSTFYGASSLTSIVIPNSVTSIGNSAFWGASSLTEILIPNSVTSIGSRAFEGASSLTTLQIPDSVTSIGDSAFYGASSLTEILIPNSVTSIGSRAFYGASSLTSIEIPNSVLSMGGSIFHGASSLASITLPFLGPSRTADYDAVLAYIFGTSSFPGSYQTVSWFHLPLSLEEVIVTDTTTIGPSAFHGASSLISIVIPEGVTSIGDYAFAGASGLTHLIIPDSVTSMGDSVFRSASGLISIELSKNAPRIGDYAFFDASSLVTIVIPEGVTSIGALAFRGVSSLISIEIPNSVVSISDSILHGASSLESIKLPFLGGSRASTGSQASLGKLFGGAFTGSYGAGWNYHLPASLKEVIITDATRISEYSFLRATSLTKVVIPNTVTHIEEGAFSGASGLTQIVIPDSVTFVGLNAFLGTSNLTIYVQWPSKPIGWDASWNPDNRTVVWGHAG